MLTKLKQTCLLYKNAFVIRKASRHNYDFLNEFNGDKRIIMQGSYEICKTIYNFLSLLMHLIAINAIILIVFTVLLKVDYTTSLIILGTFIALNIPGILICCIIYRKENEATTKNMATYFNKQVTEGGRLLRLENSTHQLMKKFAPFSPWQCLLEFTCQQIKKNLAT